MVAQNRHQLWASPLLVQKCNGRAPQTCRDWKLGQDAWGFAVCASPFAFLDQERGSPQLMPVLGHHHNLVVYKNALSFS